MKNKLIIIVMAAMLATIMMYAIIPMQVFALSDPRPRSGDIGDNLHWEISQKVLTITGTGAIPDYVESDFTLQDGGFPETVAPWFDLTHHHYYNDWIYVDKIVIGEGITTIGDFAFFRMKEYELELPDSLVEVKKNAFFDNASLKSVILPPNLKKLGLGAFGGEYACTDIQLNDKLEVIGHSAFDGCPHVTSVYIPDSVTTLGENAFRNCEGLKQVRLPENLKEIPTWAFVGTGLTSLEVPASVELIDYQAFGRNEALESVTFKEGSKLKEFGKFVFFNAVSLTDIVLPDTLETMDTGVFQGCSALESMEIPASVTSLANQTFRYCSNLTSVTLHDGISAIGDFAFEECTSLPEITIPETVKTIGNSAFKTCTSLPKIEIPDTVTSIGTSAFEACGTLSEVGLTDGLLTIGGSAFKTCTSLSEIEIPDTVTTIGASAFNGCTGLGKVTFGKGLNAINGSAFLNCPIDEAVMYDGVTTIGASAFKGCTNLKKVVMPDSVSTFTIRTAATFQFSGCSALETIVITSKPDNVNKTNINSLAEKLGTVTYWGDTMNATVYVIKNSDAELTAVDDDYAVPVNAPGDLIFMGWKTSIDGEADANYASDRIVYAEYSTKPVFEFVSKNLALDSAFAFKFYGYLYDENPAEDAYMEFKIGDIRTERVALDDAVPDSNDRYVFTCYLNVLELDEKIEATFYDGDIKVERKNPLSVTDYLDKVLDNHKNGTEEDIKIVNLVNAISNYAHYAQIALDETHTEYEVGNGGKYVGSDARTAITLHTADELAHFASVKNAADGFTDVKSTSRSLVLDDETAIVIYITPASESYEPTVKVTDKNGNDVSFTCEKQTNGKYKVVIRGIAAHKLADTYTVDIDGKLTYTNLSALSYAYSILSGNQSEAYKNAVSALYDYYTATVAYMK